MIKKIIYKFIDHFKPWKFVAEMELVTTWLGGIWSPMKGKTWEEKHTIVFYEKTPEIRKIKIIGDRTHDIKEDVEKIVYKWRDHKGNLPKESILIND